jgi:hypothetical protein
MRAPIYERNPMRVSRRDDPIELTYEGSPVSAEG